MANDNLNLTASERMLLEKIAQLEHKVDQLLAGEERLIAMITQLDGRLQQQVNRNNMDRGIMLRQLHVSKRCY
ncbi:hypothetical protein COR50_17650 [Chitinophaga caeni]|uniref:SlyX protein n=1 Tax=Chitinophaga caeni TaxID=2029983 RepID=A0A291QY47_9BACT|nr:hypothetical protein [Chitinophaga caeni]ATL48841.1 hypothetical protein COR50_17650 [Chitinophaga caeni]